MGTASTMQVMAEALGLMLPGSALMPATSKDLREFAKKAGKQAVWLAEHNLTPDKIVTMKSFENAIMVHAAISGSTNSLLHIPAIAKEFGIEIDGDTFDRLHRGAHYLLNIRPGRRMAGTVLLLCRRGSDDHGRDQGYAASGCYDSDRKNTGRKPGRAEEKWILR